MHSLDKLSCGPVDRLPISFLCTLVVFPPSCLLSLICSFIQKECTLGTTRCCVGSTVNRDNGETCFDLTNTLKHLQGTLKHSRSLCWFHIGLMGSTAVPNVCTFNKKIYCKICIFKYFCAMHIFRQQNEVFFHRLDFKYSNR